VPRPSETSPRPLESLSSSSNIAYNAQTEAGRSNRRYFGARVGYCSPALHEAVPSVLDRSTE
jgi:hypothetical protein